jgi:sugar/nucleoside kinase (ribokinase family)
MNHYDIVFIGHTGRGTIIPFDGPPFIEEASPVVTAPVAASCLKKRIGVVTRISDGEKYLLEPLKTAGVDLFTHPGKIFLYRVVFRTANVDQRQHFRETIGEPLTFGEMPPFEPCLVHLCLIGCPDSQIELMRSFKERGFRVSVDMQNFMLKDDGTGAVHLRDVPEKKEIVSMTDFLKLDYAEGKMATGVDDLQAQADILEEWGSPEMIITSSEGILARSEGRTAFAKFTNRSNEGRMGRGDTVVGSYLARRLDYSIEDSLRFAAALTSIKLESSGPFKGSLEEVFARIQLSKA